MKTGKSFGLLKTTIIGSDWSDAKCPANHNKMYAEMRNSPALSV